MGRYCIPDTTALQNTAVKTFKENFYDKYNIDKFTDYIGDLVSVWYVMAICFGIAFVLGMLYLLILRCCAGVIIWFSIIAILGVIGGGGYWCYHTKNNYDETDSNYKYL